MTREGWTIRFVGGPWHNRLVAVSRKLDAVAVRPAPAGSIFDAPDVFTVEHYYLKAFVSAGGASYWQMLHESLYREPPRWTFDDAALPQMPLNEFEVLCRLSLALKPLRLS